jgi:hypothetical protein
MFRVNLNFTRLSAILILLAVSSSSSSWQRAQADPTFDTTDSAASGGTGYQEAAVRESDSSPTGQGPSAMPKELSAVYTQNQQTARNGVPFAGAPIVTTPTKFAQLDKVYGRTLPQQLPQARFNSFVRQAGGNAERIFGDDGGSGVPPMSGYTDMSRINAGINSPGLTTGHHDDSLPPAGGFPN